MLQASNNLGIARVAVPDVENAPVRRQEPNLTRERVDVVCTEHVGKQLFGKCILGRILLVAKSQMAPAHKRELAVRPGGEFQDLNAVFCDCRISKATGFCRIFQLLDQFRRSIVDHAFRTHKAIGIIRRVFEQAMRGHLRIAHNFRIKRKTDKRIRI